LEHPDRGTKSLKVLKFMTMSYFKKEEGKLLPAHLSLNPQGQFVRSFLLEDFHNYCI
jgi:hypothetical protein